MDVQTKDSTPLGQGTLGKTMVLETATDLEIFLIAFVFALGILALWRYWKRR